MSLTGVQDPESTGASVATALEKFETSFQSNLEEMYVEMHKNTFKKMRRMLPKTRQLMNWSSAAHGVASSLGA